MMQGFRSSKFERVAAGASAWITQRRPQSGQSWKAVLRVRPSLYVTVAVVILATAAQADTYYVDGSAGPYGAGTIPEPFRTISAAVQLAEEGDTIRIREGIYTEPVAIERDGISLAAWGNALPELRSTREPSLIIRADDCRIMRLRFSGAAGVRIEGAGNRVRGCIFHDCVQPVKARGRTHTIMLCVIRNCLAKGALFDIAGPGSDIGWNRFVNNAGADAAAISCRGRGCAVRNNIVFGDAGHAIRYGIRSASGPEDNQFDSCAQQQFTYNRFYGGVREAFIAIEGDRHAGTRIARNTIVDVGSGADGIQCNIEGVTTDSNLIGAPRFASTDPDDPAFLWLNAAGPVERTDAPSPYSGARPPWPGSDPRKLANPGKRRNLALGRTYLFQNQPRHGSADLRPICLTDGYAPRKMWGDKDGTDFTGWHMNGIDNRLFVWLDLDEPSDIDAVRVYAPHQHVWRAGMPLQIDVSVSTDDTTYRHVGSILPELPQPPGNYWNAVDGLQARGRYVLLTVYTDWSYTGLGEIEVLGTKAEGEKPASLAGPPPRFLDEILSSTPGAAPLGISSVGGSYIGRYRKNKTDLLAIEARAHTLGVHDRVSDLIVQATEAVRTRSSPDARVNPEVAEALRRVSTAALKAAYGQSRILISASTPYEKFSGSHIPLRHDVGIDEVSISACGDEREPGAFFVTNPTADDVELRIDFSACRSAGGAVFPSEQIVLRSPVDFVIGDPARKVKGDFFHDKNNAIVLLDHGAGNRLSVKSLDTRQVWINVDTTDVAAGTYRGKMTLAADGIKPITVRLLITVHPIRIPEQLDLHAYMWSYWHSSRVVAFRAEAFRDAVRHKANTILDHNVPHPVSLGKDGVDEEGHMVKPLNYDGLDWQIDQWNKSFRDKSNRVKFYIFWLAFGNQGYPELRMGIPVGSPRWNTLIVEWFNDIAAHLKARHRLTTDNFAFYVQDELEPRQVLEYYDPIADALRAADPQRYPHARNIKFFVNPMTGTVMSSSWEYFEQRYEKLGLLAPLSGHYPDRILESLHRSGGLVWSHSTNGKDAGYGAKLTGWRCMQKGFAGMGFFIYIYSSYPSSYDRVYTKKDKVPGAGDETIVPTRTWEAWRDGQEDWYLLSHLKRSAHEVRESDSRGFARAMKVFHGAVETVFATPADPRASIRARETIIAEILRLRDT